MKLYLIGNGFDLYHGFPSTYKNFAKFLSEEDPDLLNAMADMYGFRIVGQNSEYDHEDEDDELYLEDIFWSCFEERLGDRFYLEMWVDKMLDYDLGLENDDPVPIEISESINAENISERFSEWIQTCVGTKENYEKAREHVKKLSLSMDDYYINFNYTITLEEVYKIPASHIVHVHGECDPDIITQNLVVGHNYKYGSDDIEDMDYHISGIHCDKPSQEELNEQSRQRCVKEVLERLYKNVDGKIDDIKRWLRRINEPIDEIYIYGLSCGKADEEYIRFLHRLSSGQMDNGYTDFLNGKIKEEKKYIKWHMSYHDEAEAIDRIDLVKRLGINDENVELFRF